MRKGNRERKHLPALLALLLCCALMPLQGFAFAEESLLPAETAIAEIPAETEITTQEDGATQSPIEIFEETPAPAAEATAEPEATPEITVEPTPEITVEPTPEMVAEPSLEPAPESALEATAEPGAVPSPEASPEATDMPEALDQPDPTPEVIGCIMVDKSQYYENLRLNPDALDIPAKGMPIPRLYQSSYKTVVCTVGGESKTVSTSGCGPTAASMLIAYATQKYDQTPYTLFYWAALHGYYYGNGFTYEAIQDMLVKYGVDGRLMGVSSEGIINHLSKNRPIIIKMGPGTFTQEGHYIVLRGLDENGNVLVNDPNNAWLSSQSFPASLIAREAKDEFMIVSYTPAKAAAPKAIPKPADTPAPVATDPDFAMDAVLDATMAPAVDTPKAKPGVVSGDRVNLRAQPVDGEVAAVVLEGTHLQVLDETDIQADGHTWYRVFHQQQKLYIRSDMLVILP